MLQLGDVRVEAEEIVRVVWRAGRLSLVLRWSLEELPVLFDLPGTVLLSWHGEGETCAGIPVRLERWEYKEDSKLLRVSLAQS